jgi:uncharacterized protein (UPF0335 family)
MRTQTKGFSDCRRLTLYCMISFLFCVTPALAQGQGTGNGQDIQAAVTTVLGKTHDLTSNMDVLCDATCQATDTGKMFKAKVDQMKAAQTRAEKANKRATPDDYDKINRRKGKNKHDDGCDPNIQICVADTSGSVTAFSSSTEPEIDDSTGQDAVSNLNDVATDVDQLNQVLSGNAPPPPPTVYQELSNAEYFFPQAMWPSPRVVYAAFLANQAAEKVAELAKPPCDETLVALGEGGNGALACLAKEGIYMVVNYTYEAMEYIVRERANSEITGAYERIGDVYYQLLGTGGDINAVKQVVDAMGKELLIIEKNQQYIMMLLTTPQGQRPGFPTGGGASGASAPSPKGTAVVSRKTIRH